MAIDKRVTAAKRRRAVADLAIRGLHRRYSLRELADLLAFAPDPEVNPATGEPWSHETLRGDLEAITSEWRQQAAAGAVVQRADLSAKLDYLIEKALEDGRFESARRAIKSKARLLGLSEIDVTVNALLGQQMAIAVQRLRAHFSDRPELLREMYEALSDGQPLPPAKTLSN